ncbi:PAS domain-containing protein [Brevundimonas sp.]|uniref:PAS domain-containing protein n=1 Tax=Brevundimonas sp. TaxID=1871086 RepID=UPI003BAA98B5
MCPLSLSTINDQWPNGWSERDRIAALRAYGVLHTAPENDFDDIVALAARICDAPTALISLVDSDTQWFKARIGLDACETGRDVSFCDYAMREHEVMVVRDATQDPRFANNALVTGALGIRFYAGAPLVSADGLPVGSLCIIDYRPRPEGLTDLQAQALSVLARQVISQMELRKALAQRKESEETARRAVLASEYVGAWDWDIVNDRVVADERFARMYGVDLQTVEQGAPLTTFMAHMHPEDVDRVAAEIQQAMEGDGVFVSEYRLQAPGAATRWVVARGQIYFAADGSPEHFPGISVDISERKALDASLAQVAAALSESEAKFRAIADSMPQMVWSTQPDGLHDYYNARWYEFTGVAEGSTDGEGWAAIFHPEDQPRAWEAWRHSLATGDLYEIEYRLRRHDGVYRWTLGRAVPIRNEASEIVRWFGTCTDIDDLKRVEQNKELLSQELSHRIKNIFAVVSALIALSARQHPEAKAFASAVRNRIGALARAHEFVRPHSEVSRPTVGDMTLHAFLEALFKPYADDDGATRVVIEGDDAVFDDQAATSVALLFHELATNAAKYGALSVVGGRVILRTEMRDDRFVLIWTETGGPAVTGEPTREGFGTSLATLSVQGQLGGRLERIWRPEGLKVVADLPATALSRRRAAEKSANRH